jgi:hypothetical protein
MVSKRDDNSILSQAQRIQRFEDLSDIVVRVRNRLYTRARKLVAETSCAIEVVDTIREKETHRIVRTAVDVESGHVHSSVEGRVFDHSRNVRVSGQEMQVECEGLYTGSSAHVFVCARV